MATRLLVTTAVLALVFLPVAPVTAQTTKQVVLKVAGMTWPSCGWAVAGALKRVDGVKKADVRWEEGEAVVEHDPARVTPEQLVAAIQQVGFRASVTASR